MEARQEGRSEKGKESNKEKNEGSKKVVDDIQNETDILETEAGIVREAKRHGRE